MALTLAGYLLGLTLTSLAFNRGFLPFLICGVFTAVFNVRLFSIFHDCTHRSFHPSKSFCLWMGRLCGLFSGLVPFAAWSRSHISHHANLNNLELKLPGDILVYTVREYQQLSWVKKVFYRIYRHPLFLVGVGGFSYFLVLARIPWLFPRQDRSSIWYTNAAVAIFYFTGCFILGTWAFLSAALFSLWLGTMVGVIIFYTHHQFEGSVFLRGDAWDLKETSLHGSSYFKLPEIINWMTINIGLHHIHHLHPLVPSYLLPEVLNESDLYRAATPFGLKDIAACFRLKLYSEEAKKLVPFSKAHTS